MDECKQSNGNCDHGCVNEVGGYTCECNEGFQLQADNKTCSGKYKFISGLFL